MRLSGARASALWYNSLAPNWITDERKVTTKNPEGRLDKTMPWNPPRAAMKEQARHASNRAGNATRAAEGTKTEAAFRLASIDELQQAAASAKPIPA